MIEKILKLLNYNSLEVKVKEYQENRANVNIQKGILDDLVLEFNQENKIYLNRNKILNEDIEKGINTESSTNVLEKIHNKRQFYLKDYIKNLSKIKESIEKSEKKVSKIEKSNPTLIKIVTEIEKQENLEKSFAVIEKAFQENLISEEQFNKAKENFLIKGNKQVKEALNPPKKEAKKSKKLTAKDKVHAVMSEFKAGTLNSSSGEKVTDRKQAVAIAMSEAGLSKSEGKVEMDIDDFLNEHEDLVRILREGDKDEREKEAKEQKEEVKDIKVVEVEKSEKTEYGCLMAYFKPENWDNTLNIIDKKDIHDEGLENEPHVTILYGFHDIKIDDIKKEAKGINEITVKAKGISHFECPDYDVVKYDIESDVLTKLNKKYKEYPHTNEYSYHPHMTIGYVKKGTGKKYDKKIDKEVILKTNKLVYSKPDKTNEEIILPIKEDIKKAMYTDTPENRKLGRVGQSYGAEDKKEDKDKTKDAKDTQKPDKQLEQHAKKASDKQLEQASKEDGDPKVKESAKAELKTRDSEDSKKETNKYLTIEVDSDDVSNWDLPKNIKDYEGVIGISKDGNTKKVITLENK